MTRRAVFMDRDGTVSEEVGYVNHIDRYRLLPGSVEAIQMLNRAGLPAIVVTNQSGVARGLFDESLVHRVHERLAAWLGERGARLDGIYYCPHHPREGAPPLKRDCECRKPRPGLLMTAAREHGLDLASSYMIGDSAVDMELAANVGAKGVLVLTGYGRGELDTRIAGRGLRPAHVASDLLEAVGWILDREKLR